MAPETPATPHAACLSSLHPGVCTSLHWRAELDSNIQHTRVATLHRTCIVLYQNMRSMECMQHADVTWCRKHKADNINIGFPPYAPSAALSMYAPMIKAYNEHVPLDQMRIVNYQSLVNDPLGITNQMLRFLGVVLASQDVQTRARPFHFQRCCSIFNGAVCLRQALIAKILASHAWCRTVVWRALCVITADDESATAGLEEYTQQHMDILQPKSLGFKGQYADGTGNVPAEVNELLQEYFAPLNKQLDQLLANHPIPWQPFTPHVATK